MALLQKGLKEMYIYKWVDGPSFSFSYNFRGGSLAGFQAAGGSSIEDNGSHTFDANGLGQTNGSNDRQFVAYVPIPDLSDASVIEIISTGSYQNASWSNGKGLGLCVTPNGASWSTDIRSEITFSTNGGYQGQGIVINGVGKEITQQNMGGGDYTFNLKIDLSNKVVTLKTIGATQLNKTLVLSDSDVALIRTMKYGLFYIGRGYSSYNGERLKTASITIE